MNKRRRYLAKRRRAEYNFWQDWYNAHYLPPQVLVMQPEFQIRIEAAYQVEVDEKEAPKCALIN